MSETARPERPQAARVGRRKRRRWPLVLGALAAVIAIVAVSTLTWVDRRIQHVSALSGAANTPGQTILVVGSDSRDGWGDDGTVGARTDTIILIHQPESGPTAMISIPRDSYVDIPGYGGNKINAAFAFGGAPLLVQTVEQLTGLTVDRYLEVGFNGVQTVVDAVGGVELCYDSTVSDPYSGLDWTAGCHVVGGATALAFSRMRYEDPLGDIGRTQRQRQVISAVAHQVMSRETLTNPAKAKRVAEAGLSSFAVNDGVNAWDLMRMALVINAAQGEDAVTGTPPIATIDYRVEGVGSAVLLDPDKSAEFWSAIEAGSFEPGTTVGGL